MMFQRSLPLSWPILPSAAAQLVSGHFWCLVLGSCSPLPIAGKSRGFGFVVFTTKEAAEAALAALNNTDLDGRTIRVDLASRGGGGGGSFAFLIILKWWLFVHAT